MNQRTVEANGIEIALMEEGPLDGPLALCLHGFPDTAHTWRHLLPELALAGFHAVAPWMRGYAPTSIPDDGCYQTGALAVDACMLHEALGGADDAVIVGHDWGAFAAYGAACYEPERWRRLATLAVPPPAAMMSAFFSYRQLKRSFYIFFFQTPLAETAVSLESYAFLDSLWADWSPGYGAGYDLAKVKESIGSSANLQAAISYYRAMFDPAQHDPSYADAQLASGAIPEQPLLYLHGQNDGCMGAEVVSGIAEQLPAGSRFEVISDAGHFLHLERPEVVNPLLIDFLLEG